MSDIILSIITINFNGLSYTKNFLNSLYPFLTSEWEVIVVDNGSKEDEAILLQKEYPWIKSIRSEKNLGFSGGNNLGVKQAKGEYFLFINNDVLIEQDCISLLLNKIMNDPTIAAISPKIRNLDGSLNYAGCEPLDPYLHKIHYRNSEVDFHTVETPLIHGAAVMISKQALKSVNGWPEEYFLYSEEVDLSLHLQKKGFHLLYEPRVELLHIGSCSTGKNSPLVCYYNARNRLLLYKRNLKGEKRFYAIAYHLLFIVPHNIINYLRQGKYDILKAYIYGVMDFLIGHFGYKPFH
ncbi:hypothetical protein B5F77_01530 [Parabacteroides sp. An277]|uniref:glycosyltransferase family 2 protein n=1 Tax=Parabacteroides sp. An277 TaxID=1965619 RepID=UPI000B387C41|nr:glycosyltransferase family 2 protein [Parabacteroides sp. An277]OUO55561.1 hypothetical protein B5F77_01530 [Parabacteroides sp. An277]